MHRRSWTALCAALIAVALVACSGPQSDAPGGSGDGDGEGDSDQTDGAVGLEPPPGRQDITPLDTARTRPATDDHAIGVDAIRDGSVVVRSTTSMPQRPRVRDDAPEPELDPVANLRVDLVVEGVAAGSLDEIRNDPDVAWIVPVRRVEVDAAVVLVVSSPAMLRPIAPSVSADAAGVWGVMDLGEMVVGHTAAREARLAFDDDDDVADIGGAVVGAWADLVDPAVADAVTSTASGLDGGTHELLVALRPDGDGDADAAAERLEQHGTVRATPAALPHRAEVVGDDPDTVAAITGFTYRSRADGTIAIDPRWIRDSIVVAELPIIGEVACHRLILIPMARGLARVEAEGLAPRIDPDDYAGCFAPRTIDRDPLRVPSMHAWGLAFDINATTNALGEEPRLEPAIVDIFEAEGLAWGGRWNRPDGMHFEVATLHPDDVEAATENVHGAIAAVVAQIRNDASDDD